MKERIEKYLARISQVVLWLLIAMPLAAYSASDYGKLKLNIDVRTMPGIEGHPPEYAIDGDLTTQWISEGNAYGRINYFVVEFNQETTVEEFRVLYDTSRYTDGLYLRAVTDDGTQNVSVKDIGNWDIPQGTEGWINIVLNKPVKVTAPTVLSFQFYHHDDAEGNRFYGDFNLNQIELFGTGEVIEGGEPPISAAPEYRDAYQFLRWTTFGPNIAAVEALMESTPEEWLEQQLNLSPSYHLERYQTVIDAYAEVFGSAGEHINHRANAWWDIALYGEDQLRQRVAFALSQLVVVSQNDAALAGNNKARALANYYDILVRHAFGSYKDLLREVSNSPVMGLYLTFDGNKAESITGQLPDQNYAREIMQLFTLGELARTLDGGYVYDEQGDFVPAYYEEDVVELSRVFTGWAVNANDLLSPMKTNASNHDSEPKQILGQVITGGSPEDELEQVLDLLISQPETAIHVSSHLIRNLVTSNPSQAYLGRVAQVFADSGGDLGQVVSAILLDPELLAGEIATAKAREPILVLASIFRGLNAKMGNNYPYFKDNSIGYGFDVKYSPEKGIFSQSPLGAPSVFNFYPARYIPKGPISEHNLGKPEEEAVIGPVFALYDPPEFVNLSNMLFRKLNDATYDGSFDSYKYDRVRVDYSPFVSAWKYNREEFLQLLADTFFAGEISDELYPILSDTYDNLNNGKQSELRKMFWVALMSPEFLIQE